MARSDTSNEMTGNIYIVDDDEAVRDALRALFEAYGYAVQDFTSGTEFIAQYVPAAEGCVLLDVNLPGIDGFEVLRQLAASDNHPAVIIMTARTDSQTSTQALEAGAAGFVQKPFVSRHLLGLVQEALRGGR